MNHDRAQPVRVTLLTLTLGATLATAPSAPRDPAAALRRGIELAQADKAELALERFDAVAEHADDPAIIARAAYAAGTLRLEMGELAQAIVDFRRTDTLEPAERSTLRRDARFNLAHAMTRMVPPDRTMNDPELLAGAVIQLRRAAAVFRDCLAIDPSDDAAARNAERLLRRADSLDRRRQQIERAMSQASQAGDQLSQLAERQEDEAQRSANSDGSNTDDLRDAQSGLSEETDALAERLRELARQAREQGDGQRARRLDQAADQAERARDAQRQAQGELDGNNPGQASPSQSVAADALRRAAAAARRAGEGDRPGQQGQNGQGQDGRGTQQPDRTEDGDRPGDATAREAIERERRLRRQRDLQRGRLARPMPVEEDW